MPSFLDLPREIRDLIYAQVFISPNGYVEPVLRKAPGNPRFSLNVAFTDYSYSNEDILSLSLPRSCRQIYEETKGMFWSNNTFYFHDAANMTHTLKTMGQIASRLITSITLGLSHRTRPKDFPKALRLLTSRARHGCFKRLCLNITGPDYMMLAKCRNCSTAVISVYYDDVLEMLREGSNESKFERQMSVDWVVEKVWDYDTVRELHLAWGGSLTCKGKLEWRNYEYTGDFTAPCSGHDGL